MRTIMGPFVVAAPPQPRLCLSIWQLRIERPLYFLLSTSIWQHRIERQCTLHSSRRPMRSTHRRTHIMPHAHAARIRAFILYTYTGRILAARRPTLRLWPRGRDANRSPLNAALGQHAASLDRNPPRGSHRRTRNPDMKRTECSHVGSHARAWTRHTRATFPTPRLGAPPSCACGDAPNTKMTPCSRARSE